MSTDDRLSAALEAVAAELKEIKELLIDFTDEGMPLRHQLPSSEVLASLVAAAALLSRTGPPLRADDVRGRIDAAQVISTELLRTCDQYLSATRGQHLEQQLAR